MRRNHTRSVVRMVAIGAMLIASLAVADVARATPISVPTDAPPGDVASFFPYVSYTLDANPNTGTFEIFAEPSQFDFDSGGGDQGITGGLFHLIATLNRATGQVLSGSMTITGTTTGTPTFSGLLLSGDVTDFGFADPPFGTLADGNIFQFRVSVDGGVLWAPFYPTATAGIIVAINNGTGTLGDFTGVFTAPFDNDGIGGTIDTFPTVPEPSTFVLAVMGLLALAYPLRRYVGVLPRPRFLKT